MNKNSTLKQMSMRFPAINYRRLMMISATLVMLLIMLAISVQSYISAQAYISSKLEGITQGDTMQRKRKLDNQIGQIASISASLAANHALLQNLLVYQHGNSTDKLVAKKSLTTLLTKSMKYNENIQAIAVLTERDAISVGPYVFYGINAHVLLDSPYGALIGQNNEVVFLEPLQQGTGSDEDIFRTLETSYTFMTQIITSDQSTCILCMLLRSTFFDDTLQGDDQMMIYNRSGMLLWQSDSNMAGLSEQTIPAALGVSGQVVHIQENQHQSLYAIGLDECDWVLIYRKDKSDFIRQTSDIILYFALAFLISAALSMTLSRIVAGRLAKPLHHLSQAAATYTVKSEKPVFYQPEYAPKGLSNQIMTFFIWVVILPVIFYSSVTYLFFAQRMQQYIIDSHRKACERAAENIDFYLLSKENAGENIIYDSLTQQVLKRGSDDADRLELAIFYQQNSLLQQGNDDFFLYDLAGVCQFSTRFSSAGSSDDKLAFTFPQRQDGVIQWQISKDRFANNLLYLIFKVNDINYYNMIGAACMVVPEYQMASIYQGLAAENVEIFVMDKQNVILSHVDKGQIGSVYPDEIAEPPSTWLRSRAESIAIFTPIGTRDWQLVSAYSSWFFERDKLIFLYEKIVVLLGSVGLILVMANLMAFMMTRPVKRYAQSLQDLARSGYDGAFSEETPISELNNLGKAFNEMILRNEALMDQLLTAVQRQNELSTQKKDAEIISLQAQINPHFLYNTFESINWMIKRDRKKEATQMIRLLSEMLRYAAQIDRPLITLSEELQYTKAYVDIMNMRYQGILDYQVDVDPELTAVKTLKLILQPFVENAILHGIAPKMAPGCIHIVCAQEASGLVITITDDGVGLSDDRIIQINKELARRCEGIGIYNVQNRIRLMFGEGYGVSVGRRAGGGTSVSLVLPLDRSPNPSPSTGSYA